MTCRQCIPVRLDQGVNHDPRLIFKARLVFKARPLLVQLRQTPRPVFEAGLVFEEIWYARKMLWTIGNGECELMMLCNSHEDRVRVT